MSYLGVNECSQRNQKAYKHQLRRNKASQIDSTQPEIHNRRRCSMKQIRRTAVFERFSSTRRQANGFRKLHGDKLTLKGRFFCLQCPVMCARYWRAALAITFTHDDRRTLTQAMTSCKKAELSLSGPSRLWLYPRLWSYAASWLTDRRSRGIWHTSGPQGVTPPWFTVLWQLHPSHPISLLLPRGANATKAVKKDAMLPKSLHYCW